MKFVKIVLVMQYHLGISRLFRSIDEGLRDRLTPVDACAEDVEEESFQLVCFGHDGAITVQGRRSLGRMEVIESSHS